MMCVQQAEAPTMQPIIVKRYAQSRLYDTAALR